MKKLVSVLIVTILILSVLSGCLFFQLSVTQSLNSELRSQTSEIQNRLDEQQSHSHELENEVCELENQVDELENQISEFQTLNSEFQNQINEQEKQLSKYTDLLKIANVTLVGGFNPYIGLTLHNTAKVTIENIGLNDVEGLTLTIEHSSPSEGVTYSLDVLHSGEKREITGSVFSVVGVSGWVTITLKLGDVIMDEYIRPRFPY
jgi:predicted nuclease with TOPRIM domain